MTQPRAADTQETRQHSTLRGRPWPKGVSGNPSGITTSKRASALYASMAADLGGEDKLSAIDRAMLMQACRLLVRSERAKVPDLVVRLSNAAARLLASLRNGKRQRGPAGPTLEEHLRATELNAERTP